MNSLYQSIPLRNCGTGAPGARDVREARDPCEAASRAHFRAENEDGKSSKRARRISQLVEEAMSPGDFSSYFLGPTSDREPPFVLTSHTITPTFPEPEPLPTLRIYPSMVGLRWNPYVDVSESGIPIEYNCKCDNCTKSNCPSKNQSRNDGYKTNIVKFCDRCTMTPQVIDVACSVCKSITYVPELCPTSDVSESACRKEIHAKCPQPILRKPQNDEYYQGNCSYQPRKVVESSSSRECFRELKTCRHRDAPRTSGLTFDRVEPYGEDRCQARRILYNEGISDSVAWNIHKRCRKKPSASNMTRECDKEFQPRYCQDGYIPYSHRRVSKYHHDCRETVTQPQYYQDCSGPVPYHACPAGSRSPRGAWAPMSRPPSPRYAYRNTSLRLPRKVLSSERNIEAYVKVNRDYYRCQVESQTPFM